MRIVPVLVSIITITASARAQTPPKEKVFIPPVKGEKINTEILSALFDLVVISVDRAKVMRVVTMDDVNNMLDQEKRKDAMGCNSVSCAVELGGALGVRYLLATRAKRLGGEFIFTASLIDTNEQESKNGQGRCKNSESEYSKAVEGAVAEALSLVTVGLSPAATPTPSGIRETASAPMISKSSDSPRFLVVDVGAAIAGVPEGVVAKQKLKQDFEAKQKRLDDMNGTFKSRTASFEQSRATMSPDMVARTQEDLQKELSTIQATYKSMQKDLTESEAALTEGIKDRVLMPRVDQIVAVSGAASALDKAGVIFTALWADATDAVVKAQFSPVAGATRIGGVDVSRVLKEVQQGKAAMARLATSFREAQASLDRRQTALKEKKAQFENTSAMMNNEVKAAKEAALQKELMELQQTFARLQKELVDSEKKATEEIMARVREVAELLANNRRFELIYDSSAVVSNVIKGKNPADLRPPPEDLTVALISAYDQRYP